MALNDPGELTPLQEKAIAALISEGSVAGAARVAGCGTRTLHHWLHTNPRFREEYRRHRREAFSHAISLAQRLAPMAMTTLARIANDTTAPYASRVAASVAILRFGRESIELDDLAERIERLEGGLGPIVADATAKEIIDEPDQDAPAEA